MLVRIEYKTIRDQLARFNLPIRRILRLLTRDYTLVTNTANKKGGGVGSPHSKVGAYTCFLGAKAAIPEFYQGRNILSQARCLHAGTIL